MGRATRKHVGILGSPLGSHEQALIQVLWSRQRRGCRDRGQHQGHHPEAEEQEERSEPQRNIVAVDLKKDFRKVATTIKNKTEGKFYRKDLSGAALARWYKIWKSQNRGSAESSE